MLRVLRGVLRGVGVFYGRDTPVRSDGGRQCLMRLIFPSEEMMGVIYELTGGNQDGKARKEDVIRVLGTKGWTERAYLKF